MMIQQHANQALRSPLPKPVVLIVLIGVLVGCGIKKPPQPPQRHSPPPAVGEIGHRLEGNQLELTWTATTADNDKIDDPAGYIVYRSMISKINSCRECPLTFEKIADIPLTDRQQFQKDGRRQMRYTEVLEADYLYAYKIAGYTSKGVLGKVSKKIDIIFPQSELESRDE
jgi:hypothetical protein